MDAEKLKNLDWMYEKPKLDLDEYLVGKKIDKALITHLFGDDEGGSSASTVGAKFMESRIKPTYDQMTKLRDDPLVQIKKQEREKARELMDNPVLMKRFKEMLIKMVKKQNKSKKRLHKSKKSKKKSRRRESSSSSNSSSSDEEPTSSKYHKSHHHRKSSKHRGEYSSRSDRSRYQSPQPRSSHSRRDPGSSSHNISTSRDRRMPDYSSRQSTSRKPVSSKAMSTADLDAKRQRMMAAAEAHEKFRSKHLAQHSSETQKEEETFRRSTHDETAFVTSMKMSMNSVEDRLKSNIHKIQRTNVQSDKFLRR